MTDRGIEFSDHARTAMSERRILEEWVEQVVCSPEVIAPDESHGERELAFGRIQEFGGRWLRVVYERKDDRRAS